MKFGSPLSAGARKLVVRTFFLLAIGLAGYSSVSAQASAYFASAYGLSGTALKTQLESIIDGHTSLSYTPDVWSAHKDLYEDPDNPDNLILFYSQASISKTLQDSGSSPSNYFNREHLWPTSYGLGSNRDSPQRTDLFHLVPAYKGVNSSRGNLWFDNSDPAGPGYQNPAHPLAPDCSKNDETWEPGDQQKGWVARAIFYMATRYSFLSLVDTPPAMEPDTNSSRMAQLSTMLEWNRRFLPAAKELYVNQRVYDDYQHNRNPYIDFPEFADAVFVDGPSWGTWRLAHFTLDELLNPAISGDHADPDGDGLVNLFEMARYSNPRLADTLPVIEFVQNGNSLILTFYRAEDSSNLGLDLVLEQSTDLLNWSPADLETASISPIGDNTEQVSMDISIGTTTLFYRLNVARP